MTPFRRWCIIQSPNRILTIGTKGVTVMVKVASLFSQLLQHIPRSQFAALVAKHKAERASKGFWCLKLFPWASYRRNKGGVKAQDQRKRLAHSDLDSLDHPAAAQMAASSLAGQLVLVQSGLDAATQSVHLSRFDELAARALWHAAGGS